MLGKILQTAACTIFMSCLAVPGTVAADDDFKIEEAKWDTERQRLTVKGKGQKGEVVKLFIAGTDEKIASRRLRDDEWKIRKRDLSPVPCRVRAQQSNGESAEKSVEKAPADCVAGTGNGDSGDGDPGNGGQPPLAGNFTILAANDLGMHCADADYRIFSILPPYNVLNAQVLKKGREPQHMTPDDGVSVTYTAADSNIVDANDDSLPPIAPDSRNSTSANNPMGDLYKGNFWELDDPSGQLNGVLAYDNLYPFEFFGGAEPKFLLRDPSTNSALGLPAPNIERYYLGDGELHAEQATMPGVSDPYVANEPQLFRGFVKDLPFFVDFPFGYTVANFNRYTAEGIPIMPTDDQGRANSYPLMKVEARDGAGNVLASVDTVVPVASEADCQNCHLDHYSCTNTDEVGGCDIANHYEGVGHYAYEANYPGKGFITEVMNGWSENVPGDDYAEKVVNAAKINILRLHDFKHGTSLDDKRHVVCANCHYTPALDLAHLGPNDDNGKEQTQHQSMSRVMHGFHASLPANDANDPEGAFDDLFPSMPMADARSAEKTQDILENTCYSCHPGKRTKCLRGAMSDGGMVCQDCHGQGTQVGNDFTENFPNVNFPQEGSMDLTKRVSWASEPKCQSCHVGDVLQVQQLKNSGQLDDVLLNTQDKAGNDDGLRLRQAYKVSDHKLSSGGGAANLAMLDYADSRFASDLPLYRLSGQDEDKGHGGLFCEGCHGSTHAIWPNANPWANDNKTANDLQGHTGTIIECSTCHEGDLGMTLEGPHGMHPVGDTHFAREHDDFAKDNANACRSCHGVDGEGSVLSRAAVERVLQGKEDNDIVTYPKGTPVGCGDCHENKLKNP